VNRALLALPGQGAYAAASLGSLPRGEPRVARIDELRRASGLLPLSELDAADHLEPGIHLAAANAWPLIWLVSLLASERAGDRQRTVAIVGSSLGWYTALTFAGALSFDDGFRLVQEMSLLQQHPASEGGGQIVYPLAGADWQPDPALAGHVHEALASGDGEVFTSVELGLYVVLAGSERGLETLADRLPTVQIGAHRYPRRLALHAPQHTPLMSDVSDAARERLADLAFRMPRMPVIDGRGRIFGPWSTDPAELAAYTLGEQLTTPYRFATSVRVALREYAPDTVLLPGPGSSLAASCGQVIVSEGYRGIRSRAELDAVQRGDAPLLVPLPPLP
jgi:[acyl-carrier-protein] S-malonyltransferase